MGAATPHGHPEMPAATGIGIQQQRTGGKIRGGPCRPVGILVPATVGSPGTGSERIIRSGRGQVATPAGPSTPGGMHRPPAGLRGARAAAAAAVSIRRSPGSALATIVVGGESTSSTPGGAIAQVSGGTATLLRPAGAPGAPQKSTITSQQPTAGGAIGLGTGQKTNPPVTARWKSSQIEAASTGTVWDCGR